MLIETLDRDAWSPTLMLDQVPEAEELARRASALRVPVRFVPPTPLGLAGARRVPLLVRRLRSARPDVFHAHLSWPLAAQYPLVAAVGARVPAVVATVHLIPEFVLDRSSFLQLRALSAGVDRYIAVSRDIAGELIRRFRWPERKIEVIHNAVSMERFRNPAPSQLRALLTDGQRRAVVFTSARLHPQKGHDVLLRAAARVPETVFVLAGESPQRAALEAQAAELGISERVRFLGFRRDIPELLAVSDVFALPSLYEGTSLALLEAMAAGRAIVTTTIGGSDELIDDGANGLLIAPRDVDALVEALRRLLADEGLRSALGDHARAHALRDFSPAAMADRVTRTYTEILVDAPRHATCTRGQQQRMPRDSLASSMLTWLHHRLRLRVPWLAELLDLRQHVRAQEPSMATKLE
jgi:glycosyltransferase involved in cell wall biosynthesis